MPETDSLLQLFSQNALTAGATVEVIARSSATLTDTLNKLTEDFHEVICISPSILSQELFNQYIKSSKVVTTPNQEQLETAKVSITDVFAGIASTGSVGLELSGSLNNHASLLATYHIAVLDVQSIVPQPRDLFKEGLALQNGKPRNFVIITGPSATADMGKLVRGAHGPAKLHIIILK